MTLHGFAVALRQLPTDIDGHVHDMRRVHKQLASSRHLEIRLGTSVVGILFHPKAEAAYSEAISLPVGTLASQFGLGVQANPNDRATAGQHAGGVTTTLRSWIGPSRFLCLLLTHGAAQSRVHALSRRSIHPSIGQRSNLDAPPRMPALARHSAAAIISLVQDQYIFEDIDEA